MSRIQASCKKRIPLRPPTGDRNLGREGRIAIIIQQERGDWALGIVKTRDSLVQDETTATSRGASAAPARHIYDCSGSRCQHRQGRDLFRSSLRTCRVRSLINGGLNRFPHVPDLI
jgi:hypothetical protein